MTRSLATTLNALGLYAIALVLLVAFVAQLMLHELPCPLCLLQRIQFAMLAVGPILNVRFGPRPSHYAASLLTAVAGAVFAARQILLHVMPGDPGYGTARIPLLHLGLHRLCRSHRGARSYAAVRRAVQGCR
jgi:disulfide bond formation protein DsbB